MSSRAWIWWGALIVAVLVAYALGGRRGLSSRRSAIEMQEATVPLAPVVTPPLQAVGLSPSGSYAG